MLLRRHPMLSKSLDPATFFISTWNTANTISGSTASNQIEFPLQPSATYDGIIDWGDGSKSTITSSTDVARIHTYASPGIYTVTFYGKQISTINFNTTTYNDKRKILTIEQWGNLTLSSEWRMFRDCINLTLDTVADVPKNLIGTTSNTFQNCTSIVKINNCELWDVTGLTNVSNFFNGCSSLTETGFEDWDVSNLSILNGFIGYCTSYTSLDLSGWDTSNFTNIASFLLGTSNITTINCANWDVSNVTTAQSFCYLAVNFNETLNNWNLAKCINLNFFSRQGNWNNGGVALTWTMPTTGNVNMSEFANSNTTFNVNMNGVNMSRVNNISRMFRSSNFNNGSASGVSNDLTWDVSNVTLAFEVFLNNNDFNGRLRNATNTGIWDTSNFITCYSMLSGCSAYNQPMPSFDFSSANGVDFMFNGCTIFNQDLSGWNTTGVRFFSGCFLNCNAFNNGEAPGVSTNPLTWDTSSGTTFSNMFNSALNFNQSISSWDMSEAGSLEKMFNNTNSFNNGNPVGVANTLTFAVNFTKLTSLFDTFNDATAFNSNIGAWDVSTCTDLFRCFNLAINFNNGGSDTIKDWDTSSVTGVRFTSCFSGCTIFNQPLTNWVLTSATSISSMFSNTAAFNQNLNSWDVTSISIFTSCFSNASAYNNGGVALDWSTPAATNVSNMFANSGFNQTVTNFDTDLVTNFRNFFSGTCPFDQPVDHIDLRSATNLTGAVFSSLSTANYDDGLIFWATLPLQSGLSFELVSAQYTQSAVDSGTTDGTTANKLVDSTQNFITTVTVGDIVHNTTDDTYAEVTAIDSDGILSLDNDIMVSGENYTIQSSAAAKARYYIIKTFGWTIVDGGPI